MNAADQPGYWWQEVTLLAKLNYMAVIWQFQGYHCSLFSAAACSKVLIVYCTALSFSTALHCTADIGLFYTSQHSMLQIPVKAAPI